MSPTQGGRPPRESGSDGLRTEATHDWRTRSYDGMVREASHDRWIRILKIALPTVAVLLIAVAVAWPVLFRAPGPSAPRLKLHDVELPPGNDVRMVNPHYAGVDSKGRAFLITAERARQDPQDDTLVHMSNLQADITLQGNKHTDGTIWLSASAPKGLYNTDRQTLDLDGGAHVYSNKGYELHSPKMHLDLQQSFVQGDDGVEGHGPLGYMRADSYRFQQDERHFTLQGQVRVSYYRGIVK